jgi:hypothetical protein
MHHYGDHYVGWRATCQQMLRERQLFAAHAGPYAQLEPGSSEALSLLATRIDSIEAQEQQRWQAGQAVAPWERLRVAARITLCSCSWIRRLRSSIRYEAIQTLARSSRAST